MSETTSETTTEKREIDESIDLTQAVRSLMAKRGPMVQRATMGQLLSIFLCCFPDWARAEELDEICELARKLVPLEEKAMFRGAGHPSNGEHPDASSDRPATDGKYDAACSEMLRRYNASMVVLQVVKGCHGSGFSVSTVDLKLMEILPNLMEELAEQVRKDIDERALASP